MRHINADSLQVGKLKYQEFHDFRSQVMWEPESPSPSSLYDPSVTK